MFRLVLICYMQECMVCRPIFLFAVVAVQTVGLVVVLQVTENNIWSAFFFMWTTNEVFGGSFIPHMLSMMTRLTIGDGVR